MPKTPDKPSWVDALEESLLIAIGLSTLITWIFTIGLLAHSGHIEPQGDPSF